MKKTVKDSRFFIKLSNEKAVNNCFCECLSYLAMPPTWTFLSQTLFGEFERNHFVFIGGKTIVIPTYLCGGCIIGLNFKSLALTISFLYYSQQFTFQMLVSKLQKT